MAEGIARTLRVKILSGEYRVGERLPTEQALATEFDVNRATLREAVKKLEMLGLVTVQQRVGIRVRDYLADSGLELLQYLVETAVETDRLDLTLLDNLLEARRFFYAEIARMAARRAPDDVRAEITRRIDAVLAATDPQAFLAADLAVVTALAIGSQNVAVRLLFNSIATLYRDHFDLFTAFYAGRLDERRPFYVALQAALDARDGKQAARLVRETFDEDDQRILSIARALVG
jgi:GntR family transcriptional repressor for pyruvate dehydrogenase complex